LRGADGEYLRVRRVLLLAVLALLATLAGCATVEPWERGALAHRSMDPQAGDRRCSEDFLAHVYDVREGAAGAAGKAGGGCGCN
jgi:hypothetical protein